VWLPADICGENVQTQDTITSYKVVGTHQVLLSRLTRFAHRTRRTQPGRREAVGFRSIERAESSSATALGSEEIDAHLSSGVADTHKTARSSSSAMDVWAWPFMREEQRIDGMTRGKKENQG